MVLGKLLGIGKEIATPVEAVGKALDGLFTSDEERAAANAVMEKLRQQPGALQVELTKIEAQHRSVFVAGWRPFIGWVCGIALFYNFIVRDIMAWIIINSGAEMTLPPELAMEHLMTVLMGLLGLGTLRTVEKLNGKAK